MNLVLSTATDVDVRPLSKLFRALGDETRLRIVALLSHGELCVCHIETALEVSQPNASRQLGILKMAGIVDSRRDGTWVYYDLAEQADESVERVLAVLTKTFGAERILRADHARVKKSCGPTSCK
ncbi:MAG: winged helix-turn-helix transcriptional regulator [Deltaproteobacteria bacterium]|nr:winged helix-turn-helix transcriptional regulator [Deltaproteobacteria bacterium]